jgi:hypothetical protein
VREVTHGIGRAQGRFLGRAAVLGAVWRRARGTAGLQQLPDVFAELLARGQPVGADVVAEAAECVFEVELVLLEPADVEVLAAGAALELARDVFVVVADDSAVVAC